MIIKNLNIDELMQYIKIAFNGDDDIIKYFDRSVSVKSVEGVIKEIEIKIRREYENANFLGIEIGEEKIGYIVYYPELLISFGVRMEYRRKNILEQFGETIKKVLNEEFTAALYSYNNRAINFLEKSGMKILFNNVTILKSCR